MVYVIVFPRRVGRFASLGPILVFYVKIDLVKIVEIEAGLQPFLKVTRVLTRKLYVAQNERDAWMTSVKILTTPDGARGLCVGTSLDAVKRCRLALNLHLHRRLKPIQIEHETTA